MITIEVKITREVYKSTQNDWKIYGAIPNNEDDISEHNLKLNEYGNITLNGEMPKLEVGRVYKAKVVEKENPKYGVGYNVLHIYQEMPKDIESQKKYFETLLTERQVKNIFEVYEGQDVIQLMKDNQFDYSLVNGIGEKIYEQIRTKIMDNLELQEALVELSRFGLTYSIVSKLVKKYGSAKLVIQKIQNNPYVLTEVEGIGFIKCDKYALEMGVEKDSEERLTACLSHVLDEGANNDGHSWMKKKDVIKKMFSYTKVNKKLIGDFLDRLNGENYKFYTEGEVIAKMNLFNYENYINKALKRLLKHKPSKIENLDTIIKEVEEKQGFDFTDEQRKAIELAVEHNVILITGKAGTGKTTILRGIVEVIKRNEKEFPEYFTCALSGKASQRIQESTGLTSSTIHRLLGWDSENNGFGFNHNNTLPKGVVVLDEGSMVNTYIGNALISAVSTGSKLIILGDDEQLEAIGAGNLFKDILNSGVIPVAILTQVHRQALKSGILSTANTVRDGIQFNGSDNYESRVIGELKDLYFKPYAKPEKVKDSVLKACRQYKKTKNYDIMNFQVIVPMKNRGELCTKVLNVELQRIFNDNHNDDIFLERNGYEFHKGDKIIQNGNNYDVNVFNGTLGIIKNVDANAKKIEIDFIGAEETIVYTSDQLNQIELAYALTVHRCQGSQFDNVVIGIDYSSYIMLSRQLLYTALTRASKLCILCCENKAIRHAVRTDKASNRNTFLLNLLKTVDK